MKATKTNHAAIVLTCVFLLTFLGYFRALDDLHIYKEAYYKEVAMVDSLESDISVLQRENANLKKSLDTIAEQSKKPFRYCPIAPNTIVPSATRLSRNRLTQTRRHSKTRNTTTRPVSPTSARPMTLSSSSKLPTPRM